MRYPQSAGNNSDYVTFSPVKYRSNMNGGPADASGQSIILYMPNNMPNVSNPQSWANSTFEGPLGVFQKDIINAATSGIMGIGGNGSLPGFVQDTVKRLQLEKNLSLDSAKQGMLKFTAGMTGRSPNQMLAMSQGKVYNPNVELLYDAPAPRRFAFNFDFVSKSAQESTQISDIIREFKSKSAPGDLGNGMFEVPYVWRVKYCRGGGGENKFLNKFKPAACVDVSVQANSQTDMYTAHRDGAPVQLSLALTFMEVDIITRKDHQDAGGQGY